MSFFDSITKAAENPLASRVSDGIIGDYEAFIDTGSYILNAIISGSIYGGIPDNKVVAFAGPEATGKTFFVMGIAKSFLDQYPDAEIVYFETEGALTQSMFDDRGVDGKRVTINPVNTIQQVRNEALRMTKAYREKIAKLGKGVVPPRLMFVLDSLGNLSTMKEVTDSGEGKDTKDMTRTQLIRGMFRVLALELGIAKIPFLITNHTYEVIGSYYPTKEMGGGGGLKYAASIIAFLTKSRMKDSEKVVIGNTIKVKLKKSRITREEKEVEVMLTFDKGLDRYYGLLELATSHGIVAKNGNKYEFPDGTKAFESAIIKSPAKFFDPILPKLEEAAMAEFMYGVSADEALKELAAADEVEVEEEE